VSNHVGHIDAAASPVEMIAAGSRHPIDRPDEGIALCLSGGGYRAMLFHVGALWRLSQLGWLPKLNRISSVSGGSITAGLLGLKWNALDFDANGVARAFEKELVAPIRKLGGKTIDEGAILGGIFLPGSVADKVIDAYRKYLFGDATLQDLPDEPRFVINATNVQSGALWRFSKPYMRDHRVGEVKKPEVRLAVAVAASSAFPPVLSPVKLEVDRSSYSPPTQGEDLHEEPFLSEVVLTDGGVYDNLGLETAWKRYTTILVSDGGGKMQPEGEPKNDWARHALRINEIIDNQVRSLRKRQVIGSFERGEREGTYWGIRSDIHDYQLPDCLDCPYEKTLAIADMKTRLKRLDERDQNRLINWGYAVCDAAMRTHVDGSLAHADAFPYEGGVA
jgi:NTE family protein